MIFFLSMEKVKMLGATPCAIAACMCPIPGDIAKRCHSLSLDRESQGCQG